MQHAGDTSRAGVLRGASRVSLHGVGLVFSLTAAAGWAHSCNTPLSPNPSYQDRPGVLAQPWKLCLAGEGEANDGPGPAQALSFFPCRLQRAGGLGKQGAVCWTASVPLPPLIALKTSC